MGADQVYFCKFNSEKSSSLDAGTERTRGKIFYYTNYRKLKNYFFEKDFKIPFFSFKKTNRPNENSKIKYFQNFFQAPKMSKFFLTWSQGTFFKNNCIFMFAFKKIKEDILPWSRVSKNLCFCPFLVNSQNYDKKQ